MSKSRFFEGLPRDVSELILSKLPLKDLLMLRRVTRGDKDLIDVYMAKFNIDAFATLSRSDMAFLLQTVYGPNSPYFQTLREQALAPNANDAAYALYALVANVRELDHAKLLQVINSLREAKYSERILTSLNITHHYLTHGNDYDGELKILLAGAEGSYINLRGATLVANFYKVDLSYADFRDSNFFALVSGASLEGANLTNAEFSDKTIFNKDTKATGMIIDGVKLGGCVIEYEEDPATRARTYDVPELEPLVRAVIDEANRKKGGGCNIL